MLLCVFVVAEQATAEQAKVDDEAEMTQGKVAAGGVIRPEGERIDQVFFTFLDTRSISFLLSASICTSKLATPYLAGAMNARATLTHIFGCLSCMCFWLQHRPQ